MRRLLPFIFIVLLAALAGFGISRLSSSRLSHAPKAKLSAPTSTPLQVVLTPLGGKDKVDRDIAGFQSRIKSTPSQAPALLERLGWSFVAKARISSDPGYYKLAEQCADAIALQKPGSVEGELLRGHIYHALHRFKDAEAVARKLVAQRTFTFDYALLGDALMEQGRLDEAVDAYQKMVDLKPCLQTYSRVAHMRWLKGDLPGAIQAIRFAVSGGSILEPEPVAWAYTKLASYELQAGHYDLALKATTLAIQYVPDYAAAQLVHGRILLAQDKATEAVDVLRPAAEKSPLPEYLWILADALRASGKSAEAVTLEKKLQATGTANDPRTFALFLASRGEKLDLALRLAKEELTNRQDIFTRDALAWAELAHGDIGAAEADMQRALAEGTKDGRLFYHAGVIAVAAGKTAAAHTFLTQAKDLERTLMPSERSALEHNLALLPRSPTQVSSR
ncbi:MAG: tetratricopeptide repeat protein [Chthoniobacterales bacterium]